MDDDEEIGRQFDILPLWKKHPLLLDVVRKYGEHLIQRINLKDLKDKRVAIDASTLLYKAVLKCDALREATLDLDIRTRHITYCLEVASQLEDVGATPIFVFHGKKLPFMKEDESKQNRFRHEELKDALTCDNGTYDAYEYLTIAYLNEFYITPQLASKLMKELKKKHMEFYVAPYDANAQLAFLLKTNQVDAVITDDPSLILFGCKKIIFKMDYTSGYGYECQISKLFEVEKYDPNSVYVGCNEERLRQACVFTGCSYQHISFLPVDYMNSLFQNYQDFPTVQKELLCYKRNKEHFEEVMLAFKYQDVYDPKTKAIVPLSNPSRDITSLFGSFKSSFLYQEHNIELAEGNLDPVTMMPFELEENDGNEEQSKRKKMDYIEAIKTKRLEFLGDEHNKYNIDFESCYKTSPLFSDPYYVEEDEIYDEYYDSFGYGVKDFVSSVKD